MLGFSALAARAISALQAVIVTPVPPTPSTWGQKGGIGKKRKEEIRKSARAEMQEHIETLFNSPAVEEITEEVKQYVKPSQGLSIHSIDYGKLARDVELVQRILAKAQEIRQEQEDEALLLMLL